MSNTKDNAANNAVNNESKTPDTQANKALSESVAATFASASVNPANQIANQAATPLAKEDAQEKAAVKWTDEQQQAITLRGKNIIVSASAGSGKTSVMIERAAGLIAEGNSISDMLIVTFTRAAAADIKDKLSRRLGGSTDPHVRAQLKLLAGADIGTLHSWCQRLIGRYFYETGLDPDFLVLEGRERSAMFYESMDRVIDEEYAAADADFLELVDILGGRDEDSIKTQLEMLYNKLILRPDFDLRFDEGEAVIRLKQIYEKKQARLQTQAEQLYADLLAADYQKKLAPAAELITCIKTLTPPELALRGSIPSGLEELNQQLKDFRATVKKFLQDYSTAISAPSPSNEYLAVLLRMAKRLHEVFLGLKKSKSKADFNDLEHHALTILQSEAGKEVKKAYRFVFVDEYQDINPLQNSIIDSLGGKGNLFLVGDLKQSIYAFRGCEPAIFAEKIKAFDKDPDCEVIRLNANHRSTKDVLSFANRVFSRIMTEDFGGTDYATAGRFVINNAAKNNNTDNNNNNNNNNVDNNNNAAKNPETADSNNNNNNNNNVDNNNNTDDNNNAANNNRNNSNNINNNHVENNNNADNNNNDDKTQGKKQGENAKDYAEDKSVNIYLYREESHTKTGLYDLTKDEGEGDNLTADLALARILQLLQKTITEKGETRAVRQSDIAVLCRKSGESVFALIKKLQKIGLSVNMCDSLKEAAEGGLVALCEYLRLIDNRLMDRPLINSLKGHFGGFSDAELFSVRSAFPKAESFHAAAMAYASDLSGSESIDEGIKQKLLDFYQRLDFYRQLSTRVSAEELIGRVVTDFEYFQAMFLRGDESPALLESFLDWTAGKTEGLSRLLEVIPEKFPSSGITGEAISVITAHSSKGLEFPFVLVLDAERKFNTNDLKSSIIVLDGLAAIKNFDLKEKKSSESAAWLLNKHELSRRQREEEMRLLYVVLTRGKYGVDIFAAALDNGKYKPAEEGTCWLDWLMPLAEEYVRVIRPAAPLLQKPAVFPPADPRLTRLLQESFDFSVTTPTRPPKTYVTALLNGLALSEDEDYQEGIFLCDENAENTAANWRANATNTVSLANPANYANPSNSTNSANTVNSTSPANYTNPANYTSPVNSTNSANPANIPVLNVDNLPDSHNTHHAQTTPNPEKQIGAGERKPQSISATELGVLYHKAMELVDFYADFEEQWDLLQSEIKQNVDKSKIKTAAKLVGECLKGYKVYKEQGFIMDIDASVAGYGEQGSLLLQGVIDVLAIKTNAGNATDNNGALLAEGGEAVMGEAVIGEAVIIDYKTGELNIKYKTQLRLYALAAKKILGIGKIKTLIYSFSSNTLLDSEQL